ncbi:hypothetical protein [Micromonospora sp. NPDC005174]|uniref:hypothetical protein n=1 Tax=Micromonospora sp. NPDC005174 TaxID=3157018 RepID=UPI0033A8C275
MLTWEFICEVDPRLAELESVAAEAVRKGAIPDRVYADAKPYVGALVGWRRGRTPAVSQPSPVQQRFAWVVAVVVVGPDDARMASQQAYEVAIGQIYDAVTRAANMRLAS